MTSNFDENAWYQLSLLQRPNDGLVAGPYGTNSTFFATKDSSVAWQWWQLFPLPNTSQTYLVRSGNNSNVFLGVYRNTNTSSWLGLCLTDQLDCSNLPYLKYGADDSCVWTIKSWGNGAYYLTNASNGTKYNLDELPNHTWLYMNNNISIDAPGQQWTFSSISSINDFAFSTVCRLYRVN